MESNPDYLLKSFVLDNTFLTDFGTIWFGVCRVKKQKNTHNFSAFLGSGFVFIWKFWKPKQNKQKVNKTEQNKQGEEK